MRLLFPVLPLITFLFLSCNGKGSSFKNYGSVDVDSTKAINLNDMLQQLQQNPEQVEFTFYAPIEEVCQNAGCWVNVKNDNGDFLRVRFKNHFVIPVKTKLGSMAYFHGQAYWDTISVELQQHLAEDAKMSESEISKIKEPKFEMNFEADGVLVEKINASESK
jgi:hypothetical protein